MQNTPDIEHGFDLSPLETRPDHHRIPAGQKIVLAAIIAAAAGATCTPDEAKAQTVLTPAPLAQPHDSDTYYTDAKLEQAAVGAGFNVAQNRPVTFYVTGPGKIELRAYPWAYSNLKKRAGATEQFKVEVDGTPQLTQAAVVDQKAGTVAGSEFCKRGQDLQTATDVDLNECGTGEEGKDDSRIGLLGKYFTIPLELGEGTHEVVLTSLNGGVVVQVVGAAQTEKPTVVRAPELQLPEGFDDEFPGEIQTGCRIQSKIGNSGDLEFKFIPPFAVAANLHALTKIEIKPESDATKVGAILSTADGNTKYRLDPIEPHKDYTATLTRISPAAGSTTAHCPDTMEATYNGTKITVNRDPYRIDADETVDCKANTFAGRDGKPVKVITCEIAAKVLAAQEARVCAYRARADQRTGYGNRQYLLRKY